MELIKWSRNYSLGVEEIDSQHKHLVEVINKFISAKNEDKTLEVFKEILSEVVDYTKYHFETEENHMALHKYPALQEHKAQHKILVKQIVHILEELKFGKIEVGDELFMILKNWLIRHVLDHDLNYGHYLND